jgi:hypothetical protein
MSTEFLEEARAELIDAARFYEGRQAGLVISFWTRWNGR